MPVNTRELMKIVAEVADEENIQMTVRSSARGAVITGIGAFIGGLFGGPVGLPIGGAVGGVVAMKTGNNFKPLSQVILTDLSLAQQDQLKVRLTRVVKEINAMDALQLLMLFQTDKALMGLVLKEAVSFVASAANAQQITS